MYGNSRNKQEESLWSCHARFPNPEKECHTPCSEMPVNASNHPDTLPSLKVDSLTAQRQAALFAVVIDFDVT